jgi:DNA-binding PucR family transcriptional regulator
LLAAVMRDEILASLLEEQYLYPLSQERDGGVTLRQTLNAYFKAGRQVSAAASAMGVSRQTVNSRLRAAEEKIGQPIDHCAAELATALQYSELSKGQGQ